MAYIPDENTEISFEEYCQREGGFIQSDEMVGSTQDAAVWMESHFEVLIELLLAGLDENAHPWIKSLRLTWIHNPSINAYAHPGKTQCYICFYLGIADKLRYIFYIIALHPSVYRDLPGSWKIEPGAPLKEWDNFLTELIAEERLHVSRREYLEREINLPANTERKKLAEALYAAAIDFLMLHELHHFWLGHIYSLETLSKLGITEAASTKTDSVPYTVRRMIETHADIYASRHAFGYISVLEKEERIEASSNWWIAVAILFLALEPKPVAYDQWNADKYPHPHLRLASLFNYSFATISELRFSEEEIDSLYDNWIRILTRIEILGNTKLVFPFTEALDESKRVNEEVTKWIETLKSYSSILHEGQVAMLKYFRELSDNN